jgi:O-acetylserine/cysteine efflux transporter
MPVDRRTEGFVLAIVAAVLWGFGPTATKLSLDGYAPEVVGIARLGTAALFFRMLGGRDTAWLPHERWGVLAGLGLGVDFVLYNYGVQRTTAGAAGILLNFGSVTTPLFAGWLLGERLSGRRLVGCLLTLVGVVWVASDGVHAGDLVDAERLLGNVLVLAAATCWSLFAVAQQRARTAVSGPRLMAPIFALGTLCTLLVLPGMRPPPAAGGVGPTLALLVLALVCTAAVYVVYTRSQECLPLSVLSAVHATVPLFSIGLAWVFLDEPMTPRLATGALTVVVGIIVAARDA